LLIREDFLLVDLSDNLKIRCFKPAVCIEAGSRRGSPVMAEACQTTSQKRKLQPDDDDDDDDDDEVEG
jgi:hypothetical protein